MHFLIDSDLKEISFIKDIIKEKINGEPRLFVSIANQCKELHKFRLIKKIPNTVYILSALDRNNKELWYRGEYQRNSIYIYIDPKNNLETEESLRWIFFHELAHQIIAHCKQIERRVYSRERKLIIDRLLRGKRATMNRVKLIHDLLPEEFIADFFATMVVGRSYDAEWFEKVEKKTRR